ncbi:hypothetical protein [Haladaptatus sp. DYF46]|uniref:hypothetical protein n=1 Tax=Haladaptatus sp. DYF46 TaxID=2886041 RepID=UPI001E4EE762|nr:hypothetical protein [Haladaptatus sp. DYF46]
MAFETAYGAWRARVDSTTDAWRAFLDADDFGEAAESIEYYGWTAPAIGVFAHVLFRSGFTYLIEPGVMKGGEPFPSLLSAFVLNFVYTSFQTLLLLFFFFGTIGAIAGLIASNRSLDVTTFKVGGYLSVVFVPIFVVASVLALTISGSDVGIAAVSGGNVSQMAPKIMEVRMNIRSTQQMQIVRLLRISGWLLCALLLRPVLARHYDLGRIRSTIALLPTTVAFVVFTSMT